MCDRGCGWWVVGWVWAVSDRCGGVSVWGFMWGGCWVGVCVDVRVLSGCVWGA